MLLLSDIYAAIQVSDYIIGSGSCGVSQFIAWNIGAKHHFGELTRYTITCVYITSFIFFVFPCEIYSSNTTRAKSRCLLGRGFNSQRMSLAFRPASPIEKPNNQSNAAPGMGEKKMCRIFSHLTINH